MKIFEKYDVLQLIALINIDGKEKECAFKEIFNRHSRRIFAYCRQKTDNIEDAKDLHQEIWLIFYKSIMNGKCDILLPHYLFGIAHNIILQNRKKNNKILTINEINFDLNSVISPYLSLEGTIEKKDLFQIIKLASNYLNETQKEIFFLKWFSGLPNLEIANITGESLANIKQKSHRSMQKIIKMLDPFIDDLKK